MRAAGRPSPSPASRRSCLAAPGPRPRRWAAPARALAFGVVVLIAAAVGVGGLVWAAPDRPQPRHRRGGCHLGAAPRPRAAPSRPEPTLHGAAPVFKPAEAAAPSGVDPAKAIVKSAPADPTSVLCLRCRCGSAAASASSAKPAAEATAVEGPPAGPPAISVARDFAGAFVVYETGGLDAKVRSAFGATATPELARALLRRPPRLPANVKVPKAKVLNVVAGPSHGASTRSASRCCGSA